MNNFSKILDKAKELEAKMKESHEKIKNIRVREFRVQIQLKLHWMERVNYTK